MSVVRIAGLLICLSLVGMGQGSAQGKAYSLDQVTMLAKAGVSTHVILERVRTTCIGFDLDTEAERRLTESGFEKLV